MGILTLLFGAHITISLQYSGAEKPIGLKNIRETNFRNQVILLRVWRRNKCYERTHFC